MSGEDYALLGRVHIEAKRARIIHIGRWAIGWRHGASSTWTSWTERGCAKAMGYGPFRIGTRAGDATAEDLAAAMHNVCPMTDEEHAEYERRAHTDFGSRP